MTISEERKRFAIKIFHDYPVETAQPIRESILVQRITEYMTPYEAHLAGGQFFYHVQADEKIWPVNVDPFRVMWAQTQHPDESKIEMTFHNDTQYPEEGLRHFRVAFIRGRASTVCKVK